MTHRFRCTVLTIILAVSMVSSSEAADMGLETAQIVQCAFDGGALDIDFSLTGSEAVLQLVIVLSMDWNTPPWKIEGVPDPEERFLQGLDKLVYVSPLALSYEGPGVVTWNQKNLDGRIVSSGWYRYYVLAFDPDSVPDSPDYGKDHRSELWTDVVAFASGKISGYDMQPVYPLTHFTDIAVRPAYATIETSPTFSGFMEEPFTDGDEIGVYSPRGTLVGAYLQYPRILAAGSFKVYGDNPGTPEIEGIREGEPMTFVLWDYQTGEEMPAEAVFSTPDAVFESGGRYTLESLKVVDPLAVSEIPPSPFTLFQNSPNPANPSTTISFDIPDASTVSLDVFNMGGQKVDTLVSGYTAAGRHSVVWDGLGFSSGIYFYRISAGGLSETKKMVLIK